MDYVAKWDDLTRALALASFLISLTSLYFTWQNRKLVMVQEKRRAPFLFFTFVNGYFKRSIHEDGRLYALQITVRNPTDTNNAISAAELAITYLTAQGIELTVRLKANDPSAVGFVLGQESSVLHVPFPITAHNVVSGWLRFHLPASISKVAKIESYRLILVDAHQQSSEMTPNLIREYRDESAV